MQLPATSLLCKDPYRVMFPIALAHLILGLLVWLPHWMDGTPAPMIEHMQLVMRGTMYGFIIGFLLTMLPRVWGSTFISGRSLAMIVYSFALMPIAVFAGEPAVFEVLLLFALLVFTWQVLVVLFPKKQITRMTMAITTATCIVLFANFFYAVGVWGATFPVWFDVWILELTMKASVLMFIFALAPFLISKFHGRGPCCSLQNAKDPKALLPIPVLLIFALSYCFYGSYASIGIALRTVLLLISFSEAIPLFKWPSKEAWFLKGIWLSLWSIIIGHALPAFMPQHGIVWNHIVYIPGYLQLCLMVGARVVCGHAYQLERIERDRAAIITILVLLFISVLSRVGVDWAPATRDLHLVLAAAFALGALVLWFMRYGALLYKDKPVVAVQGS